MRSYKDLAARRANRQKGAAATVFGSSFLSYQRRAFIL